MNNNSKEYSAEYYLKNKEKIKEKDRQYYIKNKEKKLAFAREYRLKMNQNIENSQMIKDYHMKYGI